MSEIGGAGGNSAIQQLSEAIASQFTQVQQQGGSQAAITQDGMSTASGQVAAAIVDMATPSLDKPDTDNTAGWSAFQDTLRAIIEQVLTEAIKDRPVESDGAAVIAASRSNDPDLAGQAATVNAIMNAVGGQSAQTVSDFIGGVVDALNQSLFFTQTGEEIENARHQVPDTS